MLKRRERERALEKELTRKNIIKILLKQSEELFSKAFISCSDRGQHYHKQALTPEDEELWDAAQLARCELTDSLADLDTPLAEHVLEQESLEAAQPSLLKQALRRVTLRQVMA